MNKFIGALAALFIAGPITGAALAHGFKGGDLEIGHPFIPTPVGAAKSAGGYFSVANHGAEADRLIGIESAAAEKTELHTTETDAAGVTKMLHVPELEIPAGATVKLERGSYHVMFMGLTAPLKEGELVPGTLIFEKAGRIDVEFSVDAPKAEETGHEGH